jgi:hypothetical protein
MSERRARYVGSPDGVHLPQILVATDGEPPRSLNVPHGGELPAEIDGHKIPAAFRDSLLEQKDNWTLVNRATGDDTKAKTTTTPAKADEKKEV